MGFLFRYARKIEQVNISGAGEEDFFVPDKEMDKGLTYFVGIVGSGILLVLSSVFVTVLQDYTMLMVAVMFLAAGVGATWISGTSWKELGRTFWSGLAAMFPKWAVILFIYLIVLIMNFFIPSGSAKAFLLMPLIVPVAQVFGIPAQLCVVAFAFGDGFSNVFYPTNPVLLISLGLVDVSYLKWAKWSVKFQVLNLVLTSGLLLVGERIGYY